MTHGGSPSDYYAEREREIAVGQLVALGYTVENLKGFEAYELKIMYDRIVELRQKERADKLLKKLNDLQRMESWKGGKK